MEDTFWYLMNMSTGFFPGGGGVRKSGYKLMFKSFTTTFMDQPKAMGPHNEIQMTTLKWHIFKRIFHCRKIGSHYDNAVV